MSDLKLSTTTMGIEPRAKRSFGGGVGVFLLLPVVFSRVIQTFYRKTGIVFSILQCNPTNRIQTDGFERFILDFPLQKLHN